jgi:mono/diheme cytochrome c family protein
MMLHRTIVAGLLLATTTAAGRGDDAVLARGRYIVEVAAHCGGCHTPLDAAHRPIAAQALAGGRVIAERGFRAVVPNITQDVETGIGGWTDAEIVAALRQGRHRDGRPIGPPMPVDLYRRISDADIAAIVAYLRTVSAVAHLVTGRSRYDFAVVSFGGSAHVAPPADTPAARGAYLAGPLAHCIHCHTPTGPDERRDWARTGAGGVTFTGPWGAAVSANITSDRDTGIGSWSDVRIVGELTTGHDPDGRVLAPPMASNAIAWRQLTPRDRADLVAYLRTLPPQ